MRLRRYIVLHHSLTADGQTVSWGAIERFHKETEGWKDIGYHAGVELTGDPIKLGEAFATQALIGRPDEAQAAACPQGGMNEIGLHVCCVGNYDLVAPSAAMLDRLVQRVVRPWTLRYGIPADHIVGHRDFNPLKTCPGRMFDINVVRGMVR